VIGQFDTSMLRVLRRARFGRIALVLASLLAVTGSLGLHPEPGDVRAAPAGFVAGHAAPSEAGAHDCLACLAHRSVPLTRLSGVVLAPGPTVLFFFASRAWRPLPTQSRTHEGRAPPALA
jgi:hypothetical protein